ncbi:MAG: hypothetical protein WA659_06895 [Candidatus Aquirickettsiella sp.]
MFDLSDKEFSKKYYYNESIANTCNKFYRFDCESGEGLINSLLPELKNISTPDFEFYLEFILKRCINVNRSFSDAVEFLSIWKKKSPSSLLETLKSAELRQYFNRTEYGHDGDQWPFPQLLQIFSSLIEEELTAYDILDYLFENFNFFNAPEEFVREVIGYDQLAKCIKESPPAFKQALIWKVHKFVQQNKPIDIGLYSHKYLDHEIQAGIALKK